MRNTILLLILVVFYACGAETKTTTFDQEVVDEKYSEGKAIYDRQCVSCHQQDGLGMEGVFPPLANSDYLFENKDKAGDQIINGLKGPIKVNGIDYDGIMPPQQLTQKEAKQVIDYILNSWGNDEGEIDINTIPVKSTP